MKCSEFIKESAIGTIKRLTGFNEVGKPSHKQAPKWANFLALAPNGGWQWLSNESVPWSYDGDNRSWPEAKKMKFSGYVVPQNFDPQKIVKTFDDPSVPMNLRKQPLEYWETTIEKIER